MTKIIDEDIIRQHPVSDAYREGWERTFGDKDAPPEPSKDALESVFHAPPPISQDILDDLDRLQKEIAQVPDGHGGSDF